MLIHHFAQNQKYRTDILFKDSKAKLDNSSQHYKYVLTVPPSALGSRLTLASRMIAYG